MQTVLRYNTPQVTANKGLSLRARAVTNTNRLEVCLAYTEARPNTGMVLVEVELLTGWRAVSAERLNNPVEARLVQTVRLTELIATLSYRDVIIIIYSKIEVEISVFSFERKKYTLMNSNYSIH